MIKSCSLGISSANKVSRHDPCRFIIVDAINKPEVIHYYQKNNFKFLYSSEINEARSLGINVKMLGEKPLHTRLMYFDLIDIK